MNISYFHSVKPKTAKQRKEDEKACKDKKSRCEICYNKGLFMCGKCKYTKYCGKECQTKDWQSHKIECKLLRGHI